MNNPAVLTLRLPRSIKGHVEKLAARDSISMNQFIAMAETEKLSAMETEEFFAERVKRANPELFWQVMNRRGGEPPREWDERPEGYVDPFK